MDQPSLERTHHQRQHSGWDTIPNRNKLFELHPCRFPVQLHRRLLLHNHGCNSPEQPVHVYSHVQQSRRVPQPCHVQLPVQHKCNTLHQKHRKRVCQTNHLLCSRHVRRYVHSNDVVRPNHLHEHHPCGQHLDRPQLLTQLFAYRLPVQFHIRPLLHRNSRHSQRQPVRVHSRGLHRSRISQPSIIRLHIQYQCNTRSEKHRQHVDQSRLLLRQ